MPVDAESKKFLEEVKKGKPRRFAMACKGVKILSLIVYKKGTEEKYKKQIKKEEGAGQFYGGVVSGKGKNIVFELLAENYDKPPGKDALLKQYLEAEAGMSFKPVYSIVESLSPVDSVVETAADENPPPAPQETDDVDEQPEAATADNALASQLTAALNKLTPLIKQAVSTQPDRKAEIMQPAVAIKARLDEGALDQAKEELLEYGRFLKELAADAPKPATGSDAVSSRAKKEEKDQKIAAQLHAMLDRLRPTLDQAVEAHPSAEDDLLDKLSEIVDQIEAKQFPQAKENLGTFGNILKHLLSEAETASPPASATDESSPVYTDDEQDSNPLYEGRDGGGTSVGGTKGTGTSKAKKSRKEKSKGNDEQPKVKSSSKGSDESQAGEQETNVAEENQATREKAKDAKGDEVTSQPEATGEESPPNWDACGISDAQISDVKGRTKDNAPLLAAVTTALATLDGGNHINADPAHYPELLKSPLKAREKLDAAREAQRELARERTRAEMELKKAKAARASAEAEEAKAKKKLLKSKKTLLALEEASAAAAQRVSDAEEALREAQRKVDEQDPGIEDLRKEFNGSLRDSARAADKRTLLYEMQHGALSETANPKLSDDQTQRLVTVFGDNSSAGKEALRQIASIKDAGQLEAFIRHVENTAKAFEKLYPGDQHEEDRAAMATHAIRMGARMGQKYIDGFQRYYESDAPHKPDKSGGMSEKKLDAKQESLRLNDVAIKRTAIMAEAVLDAEGKLAVESEAAKKAFDDMLFHPGSLKTFTPEVTEQVQSMLSLCESQGKAVEAALRRCGAPSEGAASKLVRGSLGAGDDDKLDERKTRQAVMSAMMTPVAQGPVGSCASTAPLRAAVTNDPISVMEHLAEIATRGTFTGKGKQTDAIPANTSLPADGGNPLQRSLEYSIATASANGVNSDELRVLQTILLGSEGGFGKTASGLLSTKWPKPPGNKSKLAALREKLTAELRIEFDAGGRVDGDGGGGGDGSSTEGQFRLIYDPDPDEPGKRIDIRDEATFREVMCDMALSLTDFSKTSKEGQKLVAGIKAAKFNDMGELGGKPWEINQSGAHLQQTLGLLTDQRGSMKTHLKKADNGEQSADRTAELVENLDRTFGDREGPLVSLGTQGKGANHAFNYLPKHPSREQITKPNSIASFQEKCRQEVAQRKIPAAKAAGMFERFCQMILEQWILDRKLMTAMLKQVPRGPDMSPAEFASHCVAASKDLQEHICRVLADREQKNPARDPKADPKDWSKLVANSFTNEIKGIINGAYPPPTVKLADTNWGDTTNHVYFSVAPDPTTGDLMLYKEREPSGELKLADDYAVAEWQQLVAQ